MKMEKVKLVEKTLITPNKKTPRRRLFLSNIDLSLVVYQESVSFFDPPSNKMSLCEAYKRLCEAVGSVLVAYDFLGGRLVSCVEEENHSRFEIDCNGAGMLVAAAATGSKLSDFGQLLAPKQEFKQLIDFLQEDCKDNVDIKDRPLISLQLTQFGCGSLALASQYNHCILDGMAVKDLEANLAALTRGDDLVIMPNPDRTIFRARDPPIITHPHFEFSKAKETDLFTTRGTICAAGKQSASENRTHLIHLPLQRIAALKEEALADGKLKNCTTFQVVAAKIWKAWSVAAKMTEVMTSTMLFPVDTRKRIVPEAPFGFAGNALVPGFARASVRELMEEKDSYTVRKVQEGMERLNDEYIRSAIDWLEVHKGVPCNENSFSLVSWWRLGLEEDLFGWGGVKCTIPITIKPGLIMLLPVSNEEGGLNICLQLPDDQVQEFRRLMTKA